MRTRQPALVALVTGLMLGGTLLRPLPSFASPAGTLDPSFGVAGMVATTAAQTGGPVAVWDDGKITLGGGLAVNNAAAFALFRLDQHGNFDQSFGSNAAVYQQFNGYSTLNALVPTPDGSMLAAGSTVTDQGNFQWYVARYDPSGDLDDSFGTSGSPRSSRPPRVRSGGWGSRVTAPSSWPVTCNNRGSSGT